MIEFILIFALVYLTAKLMNSLVTYKVMNTTKPTVIKSCPPHQWSWVEVKQDDGSVHHKHMACAKCGPLHGEVNG